MKSVFLCALFLNTFIFANVNIPQDLRVIEQDLVRTSFDVWILVSDVGDTIFKNIPSGGTLFIDASVDALLRQVKPIAAGIKLLEDKNMVNGAVVRDFSKMLTVMAKIHLELPVDLSGRLYDSADLYSQVVKLLSKCAGFSSLYFVGLIDNGVLLFLVNNGGDVLSQGVLDAGKDWRKNQTISFVEYVQENYSVKNAMASIPAKGLVAFVLGALIKKLNVADIAEIGALLALNYVVVKRMKGQEPSIAWSNELPFRIGFVISFVQSVVKSLVLTTACKATVDLMKPVTDGYIVPAVLSMFNAVTGYDEL